ncbi:hypothetical protein QBC38DRAFT_453612 [Podospora fimiseda]|uniref:Uncharacterized protein n=1 Tax=Podospora fimiseda TaxID=252190 RepID=A0AAN7BTC3_9PEZI|nr:hypothetical protein QBC38DRAFT_453612 [Podospora fimiseda]
MPPPMPEGIETMARIDILACVCVDALQRLLAEEQAQASGTAPGGSAPVPAPASVPPQPHTKAPEPEPTPVPAPPQPTAPESGPVPAGPTSQSSNPIPIGVAGPSVLPPLSPKKVKGMSQMGFFYTPGMKKKEEAKPKVEDKSGEDE